VSRVGPTATVTVVTGPIALVALAAPRVRNPMYLAILAAIVGQALVLGRLVLVPYAAVVALAAPRVRPASARAR
jgi:protein-S-isoprenylcysteine O-methyltransferase Ste14